MKQKLYILAWTAILTVLLTGIVCSSAAVAPTSATTNLRVWTQIVLDNQSISPVQMFFPEDAVSMQEMLDSIRSRYQIMATLPQSSPIFQIPEQIHLAGVKAYASSRKEYDSVIEQVWRATALAHEVDFRRIAVQMQKEKNFAEGLDEILWTYLQASVQQRELTEEEQRQQDEYMKRNREVSIYYHFNVELQLERVMAMMENDPITKPFFEIENIQVCMTLGKEVDPALAPVLDTNYLLLVHSGDATSCPLCHPQTETDFARVEAPYVNSYNYQVYRSFNPDLEAVFGEERLAYLQHWLSSGRTEGRVAK